MAEFPLGRREPQDWEHVAKYPLRAFIPTVPATVERVLPVSSALRVFYIQTESSCVGFSISKMCSLLNTPRTAGRDAVRRYDARWLWSRAKEIDEWPDTNPGDDEGTSVRAGLEVLRVQGHRRIHRGKAQPPDPAEGIEVYRWARTADEVRASIAAGIPVVWGTPWFYAFDDPEPVGRSAVREWWIGRDMAKLTRVRGGHAIAIVGASDRRQGVKLDNSWEGVPPVWLPYATLDRVLGQWGGECGLVTDR